MCCLGVGKVRESANYLPSLKGSMSLKGQKATSRRDRPMSVLLPTADATMTICSSRMDDRAQPAGVSNVWPENWHKPQNLAVLVLAVLVQSPFLKPLVSFEF
jgi:hypothetical protein